MTAIVSQFDTGHTGPILDTQLDDFGVRLATALDPEIFGRIRLRLSWHSWLQVPRWFGEAMGCPVRGV